LRLLKDVKELDVVELLEELFTSNEDAAYNEFVERFYEDVKQECLLKCKIRGINKQIGEEIAHDTFERVRKYKSFRRDKIKGSDPYKAVLAWLCKILSNLFIDFHKSKKVDIEPINFYLDDMVDEISHPSPEDLQYKKEITTKIFTSLNAKEQKVLLRDMECKKFQKYHETEVLEELASELGVKKDTIRKIRQRLKEKIKNAINEVNEEK